MKHLKSVYESLVTNPFPKSKLPQLVYHSSAAEFDQFSTEFFTTGSSYTILDGFFFTDKPQSSFGEFRYQCYVDVHVPIVINFSDSPFSIDTFQYALRGLLLHGSVDDELTEWLRDYLGFKRKDAVRQIDYWMNAADSAIITSPYYASSFSTEYILFDNPNRKQLAHYTPLEKRVVIAHKEVI